MLDYIDKLNELDTTGVEPMSHVFPVQNVFREDVVTNGKTSCGTHRPGKMICLWCPKLLNDTELENSIVPIQCP